MYLWIWVCCFNPDEVANVFPHSGQAWLLAPTWLVRMCLCKLLGSVKTLSQFSQGNLRNSPCIILCLSKFGLHAKFFGQCSQGYCPRLWLWEKNENELIYLNSPTEGASSWFLEICKIQLNRYETGPKLDIGLFVDLAEFPCFYAVLCMTWS